LFPREIIWVFRPGQQESGEVCNFGALVLRQGLAKADDFLRSGAHIRQVGSSAEIFNHALRV
jgi:hypothetical protein